MSIILLIILTIPNHSWSFPIIPNHPQSSQSTFKNEEVSISDSQPLYAGNKLGRYTQIEFFMLNSAMLLIFHLDHIWWWNGVIKFRIYLSVIFVQWAFSDFNKNQCFLMSWNWMKLYLLIYHNISWCMVDVRNALKEISLCYPINFIWILKIINSLLNKALSGNLKECCC